MALTGRLVLVAALLLPVMVLSPERTTAWLLIALLAIAAAVDVALAGGVRRLTFSRRDVRDQLAALHARRIRERSVGRFGSTPTSRGRNHQSCNQNGATKRMSHCFPPCGPPKRTRGMRRL